jgi:hypothetical protein
LAPAEAMPTQVLHVFDPVLLSGKSLAPPTPSSTLDVHKGLGLCFKVNSPSPQFDFEDWTENSACMKSTYMDLLPHFEDKQKSSCIQDFVVSVWQSH